ncbi:2-oxo-4-hydroxy-4-carboxy-5-ureidoimidazoline decarboxylase [Amphritea sp. 2_MG-2023]|uniref:2-oxo-4-hydroxy-4-carboxy-5-ureidoimidazoline decarboxylase n=1 Tax=Amphritea TaxID=515417 RepID=UPI001C06A51C|nr:MULTISPECIES: 2-oxo-4-hydroxy-4-carboxy-5-ureidoimidazoline decarboxylase [Amphritea]MBU2965327.1 2-oxo-4-hydroxy-4-carboxy-5-ureidoimidazoline decarboxylase [Amphritea atlantica]MDO6419972.1 2-oxo-4-hydroxy-4-carboxy-5-ureidoimidazoline decarboxylase [Amphritea sp. 2_MG-2023]
MSGTFHSCTPSQMSRADFIATFGDIYEHSAWIAEQAYDLGIDNSHNQIDTLQARMAKILLESDQPSQLALINAHPDLAGKAAIAGELTESSTSEQAGAGISECTDAEFARFTELNNTYKAKFGFPFIMAVKGSQKQQILAAFEERIHHSPEQEFQRALVEINKIARFRLESL